MASDFMVLWLRVLASWAYLQAVIQISSSKVLLEPVKKSLISQLGYIWNHIYILGLGVGKQCRVEGGVAASSSRSTSSSRRGSSSAAVVVVLVAGVPVVASEHCVILRKLVST